MKGLIGCHNVLKTIVDSTQVRRELREMTEDDCHTAMRGRRGTEH